MNEVGRVRGQFQTFYDPYVESEQGTPRRQLLIDRKQLQAEAIDLHHRVQRLKDDLRKDAENVRGLLAKLKQCHENGNAEAAGRQHEVQLVIWKVGDVLSQVEDVLKRDDETYGHLNLEKPTEQP
ncbi:hypothetical protein BESB_014880 [Besnoitia besnoiti]|uniref:Uncharacterized protein n=1 Tax=Besnoitia besnoiti TaxID=94643 RepID=A0A2A9M4I4_BESBE|nr:hypothetical protein BESB_014880 [Besnoitia besnoiti]PFH32875.1 hypothetical protein BESB_014880 [Besnoitia besnoiti]